MVTDAGNDLYRTGIPPNQNKNSPSDFETSNCSKVSSPQSDVNTRPPACLTINIGSHRIYDCVVDAEVAQLVEQRTENAWVPGSSPGLGTGLSCRARARA